MLLNTDIYNNEESIICLFKNQNELNFINLSEEELNFINNLLNSDKKFVHLNKFYKSIFLINTKKLTFDDINKFSSRIFKTLKDFNIDTINIINLSKNDVKSYDLEIAEQLELNNYSFNKYFTKKKDFALKNIKIINNNIAFSEKITHLNCVAKAIKICKDIVNEPLSYMTAEKLSEDILKLGKEYGFAVEVLHQNQIESLKMGGLLAVNRGSVLPPTFSILKYQPENANNSEPIVLVGKGVVFDTGGINLKPSGFLETMKSDKAGAAVVVGTFCAVAAAKLPINIIGLIPATENRPGNNAYVPEDVIVMYDGTTVEIANTDAEGRLILADALAYSKQYKPKQVIDIATLTGAALRAVGTKAAVILSNNPKFENKLIEAGNDVNEKLVPLPLMEEYKDELKSAVADMKNCGGSNAGAITAALFLQHFTDFDWSHLDIAGPAFIEKGEKEGATAWGVRLLFNYFNNITNQ